MDSTISGKPSSVFEQNGNPEETGISFGQNAAGKNTFTMLHHTKTLGDLGILKAQIDLFEKGFIVAIPLTEHAPFDLMIYKDGQSRTVQVKARSVDAKGNINISFRSTYSDANGMHNVPVDKMHIDLYCVYCPDTDQCYYFKPTDFNKSVSLRVRIPKNNQRKRIKFASDYCQVP